jgi:hypothetical protein
VSAEGSARVPSARRNQRVAPRPRRRFHCRDDKNSWVGKDRRFARAPGDQPLMALEISASSMLVSPRLSAVSPERAYSTVPFRPKTTRVGM